MQTVSVEPLILNVHPWISARFDRSLRSALIAESWESVLSDRLSQSVRLISAIKHLNLSRSPTVEPFNVKDLEYIVSQT